MPSGDPGRWYEEDCRSRAIEGLERGLIRFNLTPGFAVNVSTAELAALAADPRVKTITLDRTMAPTR
jgi:hypothetical protein